jgi:hypothetical protein
MDVLEILYKVIWAVIYLGIAAGVGALAWVTIRFNLKRRQVRNSLSQATSGQIGRVIDLVESIGTEPPIGGILIPTNNKTDSSAVISIPEGISDFPWSGRSIVMELDPDLSFHLTDKESDESRLCGRMYSFMPIPRIQTKSGKARNVFDPARYMKLQPELREALSEICPEHPEETLSAILCNGQIEFEPIDQPRIGTSAGWVQTPEWQSCDTCKKRMKLVLQLPGLCTGKKELREGTIYLFGCVSHPNETKQVLQYS